MTFTPKWQFDAALVLVILGWFLIGRRLFPGPDLSVFLTQASALPNVCPHQNGPLGEGCVRDRYLECPWHGYQFDPRTGLGPPGFGDSVPTYPIVTIGRITYLEGPAQVRANSA